MSYPLNATVAHAAVVGDVTTVYGAVQELIARLWPGMTEIVIAAEPRLLLHRVSVGGEDIDAWLTWELSPAGPSSSWTELRILHEGLDTVSGPPPELDRVLELLIEQLAAQGHGTTRAASTSN